MVAPYIKQAARYIPQTKAAAERYKALYEIYIGPYTMSDAIVRLVTDTTDCVVAGTVAGANVITSTAKAAYEVSNNIIARL